jgi:hypothetical protein
MGGPFFHGSEQIENILQFVNPPARRSSVIEGVAGAGETGPWVEMLQNRNSL